MKTKAKKPFRDPPCAIKFSYPDGKKLSGKVVAATLTEIHEWEVPYATRVELIEFEGEPEKHVRFVYSRLVNGNWNFSSQTTWTFSTEITQKAIRAAVEMGWIEL